MIRHTPWSRRTIPALFVKKWTHPCVLCMHRLQGYISEAPVCAHFEIVFYIIILVSSWCGVFLGPKIIFHPTAGELPPVTQAAIGIVQRFDSQKIAQSLLFLVMHSLASHLSQVTHSINSREVPWWPILSCVSPLVPDKASPVTRAVIGVVQRFDNQKIAQSVLYLLVCSLATYLSQVHPPHKFS